MLQRVPLNEHTVDIVTGELFELGESLDRELILKKNEQYGDSWQAEGPFLAASRMKDKITRVNTLMWNAKDQEGDREVSTSVSQKTNVEGFQDIIEMMMYGKMLMLYWVFNDLGISGDEPDCVQELYNDIHTLLEEWHESNASGTVVVGDQGEDSPSAEEDH